MNQKLRAMLGIAEKAGKLKSGNFQVEESVKSQKAYLVLIAEDSSERSKKSYTDMCDFYNTHFYIDGTKDEISHAIGQANRGVVSITDPNLAKALTRLIEADRKTEEEAWQK